MRIGGACLSLCEGPTWPVCDNRPNNTKRKPQKRDTEGKSTSARGLDNKNSDSDSDSDSDSGSDSDSDSDSDRDR